jgi:hypothetical protein
MCRGPEGLGAKRPTTAGEVPGDDMNGGFLYLKIALMMPPLPAPVKDAATGRVWPGTFAVDKSPLSG